MRPRRTLLVVINKKVEWGILSVADIAVKWVNFRLHRSGGPRGNGFPPGKVAHGLSKLTGPGTLVRLPQGDALVVFAKNWPLTKS